MKRPGPDPLGCVVLGVALLACAGVPVAVAQPSPMSPPALGQEPSYAVPTRLDRAGRVLAPVMVNGQGPYRFILDTGANRAVLAPRVLE
ncbi:MAG TPA: aspartyl protease family protein, partial [Steroidobacteraceae bacterium]